MDAALYRSLIDAVRLVASDYSQQVAVFPNFVCVPDEIASIYGDAYLAARHIVPDSEPRPTVSRALAELDEQFDQMSKDSELWTLEALSNQPEWENSRATARRILSELNEALVPPTLDWITFVR